MPSLILFFFKPRPLMIAVFSKHWVKIHVIWRPISTCTSCIWPKPSFFFFFFCNRSPSVREPEGFYCTRSNFCSTRSWHDLWSEKRPAGNIFSANHKFIKIVELPWSLGARGGLGAQGFFFSCMKIGRAHMLDGVQRNILCFRNIRSYSVFCSWKKGRNNEEATKG